MVMSDNEVVIATNGKERDPRGTKIKRLAKTADSIGCTVKNFDYTEMMDPDPHVERLLEVLA